MTWGSSTVQSFSSAHTLQDTAAVRETGRPSDPCGESTCQKAKEHAADADRMCIRVENLIAELYRQATRFLVDHLDVILLPAF